MGPRCVPVPQSLCERRGGSLPDHSHRAAARNPLPRRRFRPMTVDEPTGGELLQILAALASPHRLRILAALADGRNYVSDLARQLEMNRPLLHMHLQRLEAAGLVTGVLE